MKAKKSKKVKLTTKITVKPPPPPPPLPLTDATLDFEVISAAEIAAESNGRQAVFNALQRIGFARDAVTQEGRSNGILRGRTPWNVASARAWAANIVEGFGPTSGIPERDANMILVKLRAGGVSLTLGCDEFEAAVAVAS